MGLKNKEESFFSFGLQYSNIPSSLGGQHEDDTQYHQG